MLTITRKLEFDAGHRIPDHKSQCRNLHGHRYTVEITLVGKVIEAEGNSDNGMIMDFSDVKTLAKQHLVDVWDHAFLVYEKTRPCATSWPACPTIRPSSSTASRPWKTWRASPSTSSRPRLPTISARACTCINWCCMKRQIAGQK